MLVGCSKESTEPEELSNDNALKRFSFASTSNSGLAVTCNGFEGNGVIYVTVPDGVSISSLVPTFTIHEKATATVDGKPIESGVTSVDFTNTKTNCSNFVIVIRKIKSIHMLYFVFFFY